MRLHVTRTGLIAAGVGALMVVLSACGGGLGLRMELHEPARIPAHVFPRVFVRGDGGIDAEVLAEAIVSELRSRGLDATELGPGAPATAHLTRRDGSALLVEVRVTRSSAIEARQSTESATLCTEPCIPGPVTRMRDITVLSARAELTMRDARSEEAFDIQRVERREDDVDMGAGGRLLDRLERATLALFSATRSSRDIELRPLATVEGTAALDDARAGRIGRAVAALRALATQAADAPIEERANLYFDLGQVLRVAALDGGVELDVEARAALDEAMHLRPDARTGAALEALDEEMALRARVRAEELAYRSNREPAAPTSYE